jgi:hypothetical protein
MEPPWSFAYASLALDRASESQPGHISGAGRFWERFGRAWRGTNEDDTDRETLIRDLMEGEYSHPARIIVDRGRGSSSRCLFQFSVFLAHAFDIYKDALAVC